MSLQEQVEEARHELDCVVDLFRLDMDRGTREDALVEALAAFESAVVARERAEVRALEEAIVDEHEMWHRKYAQGTPDGVAPPIATCRNWVCRALTGLSQERGEG